MSGPDLDLEKPNAIGGLDKLVTNFALSVIAVFPTFFACVVMPWRLTPLLERDNPDGRKGILLTPGAYFPLCLLVAFIVAALLATPETLSSNNSFIGPDLAVSVQNAASEGNVWKIVAIIMPIYGTAILMGVLGTCLKPWAGEGWTLRVSLRAAFYVTATMISWLLLSSALLDWMRVSSGSMTLPSYVYLFLLVPTISWIVWIYYWFFRNDGARSQARSRALAFGMLGLIAALFIVTDLLIRLGNG